MGTRMFAKIMRIVARWYGNPTDESVLPRIFDDAVHAWKTGQFEGTGVFQAPDPDTGWRMGGEAIQSEARIDNDADDDQAGDPQKHSSSADINQSGLRIDLSRIGGK